MPRKSPELTSKLPTCLKCGLELPNETQLTLHSSTCTLVADDDHFVCQKSGCDFRTTSATSLRTHIKGIHIKSRYFACEKCEFRSVWKVSVVMHYKNIHGGEGLDAFLLSAEQLNMNNAQKRRNTDSKPAKASPKQKKARTAEVDSCSLAGSERECPRTPTPACSDCSESPVLFFSPLSPADYQCDFDTERPHAYEEVAWDLPSADELSSFFNCPYTADVDQQFEYFDGLRFAINISLSF